MRCLGIWSQAVVSWGQGTGQECGEWGLLLRGLRRVLGAAFCLDWTWSGLGIRYSRVASEVGPLPGTTPHFGSSGRFC